MKFNKINLAFKRFITNFTFSHQFFINNQYNILLNFKYKGFFLINHLKIQKIIKIKIIENLKFKMYLIKMYLLIIVKIVSLYIILNILLVNLMLIYVMITYRF